jgi:hypothetical protein
MVLKAQYEPVRAVVWDRTVVVKKRVLTVERRDLSLEDKILAKIQIAWKEVLGKNKTVTIISETPD